MRHFVSVLIGSVVAAAPAVATNPSWQHYIAQHPALAVYYPLALAVVSTLSKEIAARRRVAKGHKP